MGSWTINRKQVGVRGAPLKMGGGTSGEGVVGGGTYRSIPEVGSRERGSGVEEWVT